MGGGGEVTAAMLRCLTGRWNNRGEVLCLLRRSGTEGVRPMLATRAEPVGS